MVHGFTTWHSMDKLKDYCMNIYKTVRTATAISLCINFQLHFVTDKTAANKQIVPFLIVLIMISQLIMYALLVWNAKQIEQMLT